MLPTCCIAVTVPRPPQFDVPQQLNHIALENSAAVRDPDRVSGFTAIFEQQYLDNGYEVGSYEKQLAGARIRICIYMQACILGAAVT